MRDRVTGPNVDGVDDEAGPAVVERLVGVYDADGSLRGELSYLLLRLAGRAHCSLCDVTHGTLRRKAEFDEMRARLGVTFDLVHRDERDAATRAATGGDIPCVVAAVRGTPGLVTVLGPEALEAAGGDVPRFESLLTGALRSRGLALPPPASGDGQPAGGAGAGARGQ